MRRSAVDNRRRSCSAGGGVYPLNDAAHTSIYKPQIRVTPIDKGIAPVCGPPRQEYPW